MISFKAVNPLENGPSSGRNERTPSLGLSIGAICRLTGVPQPTLRYWEQLGLLEPHRSEGGHRFYSQEMIPLIEKLKESTEDKGLKARDLATLQETGSAPGTALSPLVEKSPTLEHEVNNVLLEEEADARLRGEAPAVAAFVGLEGVAGFREEFGVHGLRKVLQLTAFLLHDTLRDYGGSEDLASFVGEDEFLVLTTPTRLAALGPRLEERFRQFLMVQFGPSGPGAPGGSLPSLRLKISAVENQSDAFREAIEKAPPTLPRIRAMARRLGA